MKKYIAGLLLLLLVACHKEPENTILPEYADWYAIKAPEARAIEAVYGDLDQTLVIATAFTIYQTKDRGKTWQTTYKSDRGLFGFSLKQDTLLVFGAQSGVALDSMTAYAVNPFQYSLDQGTTWNRYINRRPDFEIKVARNLVTTPSKTEYSIDYLLTPVSPGSTTSNYVESVGIKTSSGRLLTLPNDHQITSLYVDSKSRLYVTASAPLCGRLKNFAFCGDQNGILYISKNPQP